MEKIVVHAPDKSSGHRVQRIDVHYNFIGEIDFSQEFSRYSKKSNRMTLSHHTVAFPTKKTSLSGPPLQPEAVALFNFKVRPCQPDRDSGSFPLFRIHRNGMSQFPANLLA